MNKYAFLLLAIAICFWGNITAQMPQLMEGWPYGGETAAYAASVTPKFSIYNSIAVFYNTLAGDINKF